MKKSLFLIILVMCGSICTYAQTDNQINIGLIENSATKFSKSPEAAAFERYGLYPVNESTGVPNVSIPLINISSGKLSLPISISYHMGGIRVNDIASSTGLGWTLNTGGMITRTIRGRADETGNTGFLQEYMYERGFYDINGNRIFPLVPIDQNTMASIPAGDPYEANNGYCLQDYFSGLSDGRYDSLSDIYTFNIPGSSGTFVYDTGRNLVQIPGGDCKIIRSSDNNFTILNDKGVQYYFAEKEYTSPDHIGVTSSNIPIDGYRNRGASAWLLTAIISEDKVDTIRFNYISHMNYEDATRCFIEHNDGHTVYKGKFFRLADHFAQGPQYYQGLNRIYSNAYISERLISSITFKNGRVDFNYSSGRKDKRNLALSSIVVKNNAGVQVNKVVFTQNYFYSGTTPAKREDYRLKLNEVKIYGNSTDLHPKKYAFTYNESVKLPRVYNRNNDYSSNRGFNYGQDHWGFYNGVTTNTNLIGVYPSDFAFLVQNTNREPSETHMKAAVLERIDYPTGGYTLFQTESNRAIINGQTKIMGGLRVNKIISSAGDGVAFTKTYEYEEPDIVFQPDTKYYANNMTNAFGHTYCSEAIGHGTSVHYNSSPLSAIGYYMGSPVIYKKVTVYEGDYNKNTPLAQQSINGKTVFRFLGASLYNSISPDQFTGGSQFPQNLHFMPEPVGWQSGLKTAEEYYKLESGQFKKIKEVQYDYDETSRRIVHTGAVATLKYNFGGFTHPLSGQAIGNDYRTKKFFDHYWLTTCTGHHKLTRVREITYSSTADPLVLITEYKYDNIAKASTNRSRLQNYLVSEQRNIYPDGTDQRTIYKYPQDFVLPPYSTAYDTMLADNMLAYPVETILYYGNREKERKKVNYERWNHPNIFIKPISVQSRYPDTDYMTDLSAARYDSYGNPLETVDVSGVHTVYIWGYKGQYPIAEIKNCKYSDITAIIDSNTINNIASQASLSDNYWNLVNGLRNQLQSSLVTTFKYEPLMGIVKSVDPSGRTTHYEYDSVGRLSLIRDDGQNILETYEYNYASNN